MAEAEDYEHRELTEFLRPTYAGPKHPTLSSPFARKIMLAAAGPLKPLWYKAPKFADFYSFKQLVFLVTEARSRPIPFAMFLEQLQTLVPTLTATELSLVLNKLSTERMDEDEVDFGEFILLLANNPMYSNILEAPNYKRYIVRNFCTPRNRVLYSGLAFFCLVQTEDDIERFYLGQSGRHVDVLKHHTMCARNEGLNELEMERRQMDARRQIKKFDSHFRTPYTAPVPLVKATQNQKVHKKPMLRRKTWQRIFLSPPKPVKKVPHKKVYPIKVKRELGGPIEYENEMNRLIHLFLLSQLPTAEMMVPAEKLKQMKKLVKEDHRAYLEELRDKAVKEYRDMLKTVMIGYSKKILRSHLQRGFPNEDTKKAFLAMYREYMPLSKKTFYVMNPWTPTYGFNRVKQAKFQRPAFGSNATYLARAITSSRRT